MKLLIVGIISLFSVAAAAKQAIDVAIPATPVASDGVETPQLRVVGRLNVNQATREQLLWVPGLDARAAEAILEARVVEPITDLDDIEGLSAEARAHLKTEGESNFLRLLQNPLQRIDTLATRK
jgi:hypothetical protein